MRKIELSGAKAAGRVALIDDEDYHLVRQYRWYVHVDERRPGRPHGPYARTTINATTSGRPHWSPLMHNLIMGCLGLDHANRNGLDNRRSNLRPATASQNTCNQPSRTGSSSQFKGVFWIKPQRVWGATITINRERRKLGRFSSEIQAALAYDAAARALHGEFALLNFPDPAAVPEGVEPEDRQARLGYSSSYTGVSWNKRLEKWQAYINRDGEHVHLGMFAEEVEAARAYDAAALRWPGRRRARRMNFPADIPAGAVLLDQKATAA